MKRPGFADICTYIIWNLCALCAAMVSPIRWVAPFSAALCAAAGAENRALYVLFGTALGCFLGDAGVGGLMASVMALLGGGLAARFSADRDARLSVWAFFCCALVGAMRYMRSGTYTLMSALLSCLLALPVAPVWRGLFFRPPFSDAPTTNDVKMAFHLLACVVIAGILRLRAEAGLFFAGFFALLLAGEGVSAGALGAFTAGMGMLLGNAGAVPAALLLIGAGAAGLGHAFGRWAQSLLFLTGLLLTAYFGWDRAYGFLFGAAVIYSWIPIAFLERFRRAFLSERKWERPAYRLSLARRHRPAQGQTVSGDVSAVERLPGGRVLMLLADGMGTGEAAKKLSERTVREAKNVLGARMNAETAFRALNRLSNGGDGAFSTLDACVIDLNSGLVRFYKSGSECSWVARGKRILRVRAASLPLGTLPEAPPSVKSVRLRPGDAVILATDGLVSALGGEEATEKLIFALSDRAPAEIALRLMRMARGRTDARTDDQSILCARLCSRWRTERIPRQIRPNPKPEKPAADSAKIQDAQRAS